MRAARGNAPRLRGIDGPLILKLQRPSAPPDAPWLVYDRHRVINQLLAVNEIPSSVPAVMGTDLTAFFVAVLQDDGRIIFGRRVADPGW